MPTKDILATQKAKVKEHLELRNKRICYLHFQEGFSSHEICRIITQVNGHPISPSMIQRIIREAKNGKPAIQE